MLTNTSSLQPQQCYAYMYLNLYGGFCTPPLPTTTTPSFRALFGSCMAVNPIPPFHRLYAFEWAYQVLQPQVAFLLGDLVYTDVEETWLGWLRVPPSLAWKRTWQVESLETLLRVTPAILMHDDHEIENGWDGSITLPRHRSALEEMKKWTDERRRVIWNYGKDVSVFIVDTRSFRHTHSILGTEQWKLLRQWFEQDEQDERGDQGERGEEESPLWKIVASPSLIANSLGTSFPFDDGDGGWNLFPKDRELLLDLAAKSKANVVFLSGDVHWALAVEHRMVRKNQGAGRSSSSSSSSSHSNLKSVWEFGASPFQALPFPAPSLVVKDDDDDEKEEEEKEEVVHFLLGGGFYHGSFEYEERDRSLTVRLHSNSLLTGVTKQVFEKRLSPKVYM